MVGYFYSFSLAQVHFFPFYIIYFKQSDHKFILFRLSVLQDQLLILPISVKKVIQASVFFCKVKKTVIFLLNGVKSGKIHLI